MSNEASALSTIAVEAPAESEYDAIYAAVMETVRGRWFLDQFARRNRNADTMQVLAAIERLESVMHDDQRGEQPYQSFRAELIEMAATIAQTRAEVVEPDASAEAGPARTHSEAAAAAQRIKDVAWSMREHGLDPATCEQIEGLAQAVLSASWLDRPDDQRAQKLGEVLGNLEHRIGAMLGTGETTTAGPATRMLGAFIEPPIAASGPADIAPETDDLALSPAPAMPISGAPAISNSGGSATAAVDAETAEPPAAHARSGPPESMATPAAPRLRAVDLIPAPELTPKRPPVSAETPSPASPATPASASLGLDNAPATTDTPTPDTPVAIEAAPELVEPPAEAASAAQEMTPPPSVAPASGSGASSNIPIDRTEHRGSARPARGETAPLLPSDPLAAIKAMSEAERIALFM
jgi:hypothetical protein